MSASAVGCPLERACVTSRGCCGPSRRRRALRLLPPEDFAAALARSAHFEVRATRVGADGPPRLRRASATRPGRLVRRWRWLAGWQPTELRGSAIPLASSTCRARSPPPTASRPLRARGRGDVRNRERRVGPPAGQRVDSPAASAQSAAVSGARSREARGVDVLVEAAEQAAASPLLRASRPAASSNRPSIPSKAAGIHIRPPPLGRLLAPPRLALPASSPTRGALELGDALVHLEHERARVPHRRSLLPAPRTRRDVLRLAEARLVAALRRERRRHERLDAAAGERRVDAESRRWGGRWRMQRNHCEPKISRGTSVGKVGRSWGIVRPTSSVRRGVSARSPAIWCVW